MPIEKIKPQAGAQRAFLETEADIAIYGGAAGGGKSFALLLEPLRHIENPLFNGVIFRRTMPQIKSAGGLWAEASGLYSMLGARPHETELKFKFPLGMGMKFASMEHEKSKYDWQGAQIPFIGYDELTHFTESMFFYMLSRLRSMSGVSGYVRATCNPDSESWVRRFIDWWIDEKTGIAIPERSGVLRWFIRVNDEMIWQDTPEELIEQYGEEVEPKSVTFIPASIYDNKILMQKDPAYLSNLKALPLVEREQLLGGNWNIRPASGLYFRQGMFEEVESTPYDLDIIRFWDRAATKPSATNPDPDYTRGLKIGRHKETGILYVLHLESLRDEAWQVEQTMINIAVQDGKNCIVGIFKDPAAAGKAEAEHMVRRLIGFATYVLPATSSKLVMASPAASQAQQGNIKVLKGTWNREFYKELEGFPEANHDDIVDTLSGGVEYFGQEIHGSFAGHYNAANTEEGSTRRVKQIERRKKLDSKVERRIKVTSY